MKSFGEFTQDSGGGEKKADTGVYKRCYETHPPLPITVDGTTYHVYGGSGSYPVVKDADVHISVDSGMRDEMRTYPWDEKVSFTYPITDMHAPKDPESFKKLIEYIAAKLKEGKKVHIGCIGGHGRTGTVLAALVKHMTGNENSIMYVREHYCKRVVESKEQIDFLHKHFGITKVEPTKGSGFWAGGSVAAPGKFDDMEDDLPWGTDAKREPAKQKGPSQPTTIRTTGPSTSGQKSLWPDLSNLTSASTSTTTGAGWTKPGHGYHGVMTKMYNGAKEAARHNAGMHKELIDVQPVKVKGNIWGEPLTEV